MAALVAQYLQRCGCCPEDGKSAVAKQLGRWGQGMPGWDRCDEHACDCNAPPTKMTPDFLGLIDPVGTSFKWDPIPGFFRGHEALNPNGSPAQYWDSQPPPPTFPTAVAYSGDMTYKELTFLLRLGKDDLPTGFKHASLPFTHTGAGGIGAAPAATSVFTFFKKVMGK